MERRIVSYERPENAFHPYLQEVAFPEGAAGLESLPRRLESAPQTPPADVLRLPETLVADIEAESRGRKVSRSDVIRERLEGARQSRGRRAASWEAIADVVGSVTGLPADLSRRKKAYLQKTGYGQKHHR